MTGLEQTGDETLRLVCIAVLVRSSEFLYLYREFRSDGIFSERLLPNSGTLARIAKWTNYRLLILLMALESLSAMALLIDPSLSFRYVFLLFLCAVHFTVGLRTRHSLDGSDQLLSILLTCLLLFYATSDPIIREMTIWFLVAETFLAYFVSGISKLASPLWRHGDAVNAILRTSNYGGNSAATWIVNHDDAGRWVDWATIGFEVAFPFGVMASRPSMVLFLVGGLLFHLGIAMTMRLNRFVFAFVATYPCLIFACDNARVSGHLGQWLGA